MNSFTQTVTAWLPGHCGLTPQDLAAQVAGIAGSLGYTTNPDFDMGEHGWTKVGTAEITLHLIDSDTMLANKVDALRAEKKKVQAEAQLRATEIDGQIQNLLAITYTPDAAELAAVAGDAGISEDDDPDFLEVKTDDNDCPICAGTGEGAFDGVNCFSCNGKGTK